MPSTTLPDVVRLREVLPGDLPTLCRQQLDPVANELAAVPPRDEEAFRIHWGRLLADPGVTKRCILFGELVAGHLIAFDRDGERQVGYWLGQELWGRGIASRALALFLAVETQRPLYAHVAKHNPASRRVLEKSGFTVVREERNTVHGVTCDEVVLLLT